MGNLPAHDQVVDEALLTESRKLLREGLPCTVRRALEAAHRFIPLSLDTDGDVAAIVFARRLPGAILAGTRHGDVDSPTARRPIGPLIMDLDGQAHGAKFMIRDRGSNFTAAFDAVLADAGIRTALCNVRTPRMNAIAERWIGGMPPRAPGPNPHLEPGPSAADPARVRDPPQSASASPLPERSRAAETAARTGRS
jgi:hypothetical protein